MIPHPLIFVILLGVLILVATECSYYRSHREERRRLHAAGHSCEECGGLVVYQGKAACWQCVVCGHAVEAE